LKLLEFDCGGNTKQWSAGVRCHEGNSRFFQERRKTGLFVNYDPLCEEVIKKARSLNIPQSCFKASKGWAIRFMHQMGLALWRRTTCQSSVA
jgi:hypothetical protein